MYIYDIYISHICMIYPPRFLDITFNIQKSSWLSVSVINLQHCTFKIGII